MAWTDERVEILKKLWMEGLSASQIANKMGGVTRNAVIGKVHRLGLSGRATTSRVSRSRPRKPRVPSNPARNSVFRSAGNTALKADPNYQPEVEPEPAVVHELNIPPGERASILTLNENTCRWPIGDPGAEDFHFCGIKPSAGMPYCPYHVRIAYQPAQDRRRKRAAGGRMR